MTVSSRNTSSDTPSRQSKRQRKNSRDSRNHAAFPDVKITHETPVAPPVIKKDVFWTGPLQQSTNHSRHSSVQPSEHIDPHDKEDLNKGMKRFESLDPPASCARPGCRCSGSHPPTHYDNDPNTQRRLVPAEDDRVLSQLQAQAQPDLGLRTSPRDTHIRTKDDIHAEAAAQHMARLQALAARMTPEQLLDYHDRVLTRRHYLAERLTVLKQAVAAALGELELAQVNLEKEHRLWLEMNEESEEWADNVDEMDDTTRGDAYESGMRHATNKGQSGSSEKPDDKQGPASGSSSPHSNQSAGLKRGREDFGQAQDNRREGSTTKRPRFDAPIISHALQPSASDSRRLSVPRAPTPGPGVNVPIDSDYLPDYRSPTPPTVSAVVQHEEIRAEAGPSPDSYVVEEQLSVVYARASSENLPHATSNSNVTINSPHYIYHPEDHSSQPSSSPTPEPSGMAPSTQTLSERTQSLSPHVAITHPRRIEGGHTQRALVRQYAYSDVTIETTQPNTPL